MDLYKRNLDEELRVFGDEDLTASESRINFLKQSLYTLANKRRDKSPEEKLYEMPGADLNEDDGDKTNRNQRLLKKLSEKYTEAGNSRVPEMTEDERFREFKEAQGTGQIGAKRQRQTTE